MRCILLREAQVGMTLAADTINAQHMLLLKKDAVLTEKNLRMLKSWGVETVHIVHAEGPKQAAAGMDDMGGNPEAAFASRFGSTTENPIMAEICRIASGIVNERTRQTR
jgi:hypothetical protein